MILCSQLARHWQLSTGKPVKADFQQVCELVEFYKDISKPNLYVCIAILGSTEINSRLFRMWKISTQRWTKVQRDQQKLQIQSASHTWPAQENRWFDRSEDTQPIFPVIHMSHRRMCSRDEHVEKTDQLLLPSRDRYHIKCTAQFAFEMSADEFSCIVNYRLTS